MRTYLWALAGCAALFVAATPSAAHAQRNNANLNWAQKMFSQLSHDFGRVAKGADTRHYIKITNLYEEDVRIGTVTSSCGCTSPSVDKNVLKSREEAQLELKVDTVRFSQQKNPTISVTMTFTNAQGQSDTKIVSIPVSIYIRPDVVFSPGNADFGVVGVGESPMRQINVTYAGRSNWNIREVRSGSPHVTAEVREVTRAGGSVTYLLTVRLNGNAPVGALQDQVTLITDDPQSPEVPVLVTARVEPDIMVLAQVQNLGELKPGEEKPFTVVLRGKKAFIIAGVQCNSENDCFEYQEPPTTAASTHVVRFKMIVPNQPGEFREEFTFKIADREEPLTCVVQGNIVGS